MDASFHQYSTLICNDASTATVPQLPALALHQKVLFALQLSLISIFKAFTTKFTGPGFLSMQVSGVGQLRED